MYEQAFVSVGKSLFIICVTDVTQQLSQILKNNRWPTAETRFL